MILRTPQTSSGVPQDRSPAAAEPTRQLRHGEPIAADLTQPPPAWPSPDPEQIGAFLSLLGKAPAAVRARAFLPKGHPGKAKDLGRMGPLDLKRLEQWQREHRGLYAVIGDGGDRDAEITGVPALFCEWDDRPRDWQVTAWRDLGLPEPTLMVDTAGRSIHVYWVLDAPIPPAEWQPLQRRLLAHAQADLTISNPSRVMRLPGSWYVGADGTPTGMVRIIHTSGQRYQPEQIAACLPPEDSPEAPPRPAAATAVAAPLTGASAPLLGLLSREIESLARSGCPEGGRDDAAFRVSVAAMVAAEAAAAAGLPIDSTAEALVLGFAARCTPPFPEDEARKCLRSAESQPRTPDPGLAERIAFHKRRLAAPAGSLSHRTAASMPAGDAQPAAAGLSFEERWAAMEAHADAVSGKPWPTMKAIASLSDCARDLELHRLTAHNLEQLLEAAQRRQRPTAAPLLPGAQFSIRATPWAVDGVFRHGLNLLVGQPGAGKSRLSAAAIAAWLRGDRSWLGREMPCDAPVLQRHALIIGTDQPLEDWALTLEPVGLVERQATGDAWLHPRLTLHPLESGTMLDTDGLATIRRWCDAHPHGVVLVDSLAACLPPGIDEDKAAVARPIHALAEAIGRCWALLTHHSRKAAGRDQNLGVGAGRGSSAIDGAVSRVIGLGLIHKMENGVMTPQESDPRRELLSTKRGGATLHLIVSSDGSGFWSNDGSADDLKRQERRERTIAGLTEAQSAVLAVLDEASGGWLTGRQVVEALEPGQEYDNRGAMAAGTRKVLKRLEVIGLIETSKVSRDRLYRLSDAGGDRKESQESHPSRDEVEKTGSNGSNAAAQRVWPALLPSTVGSDRLYSGPPPTDGSEQAVEPPEPVADPADWFDEFGPEPPEPVRATGEPAVEQAKPVAPQHESQESHPVCAGSGEPVALLLSPPSDRIERLAGWDWWPEGEAPQPPAAPAPVAPAPALPPAPMAEQTGLL